jgi:probable F420-dependent oxidoreductase
MYGLTVFNSGRGPERFRQAAAIAVQAEQAGFDAVWTGELYNRSATIPMATLAAATERVRVGSNIAYGVGRSPLVWAAEARDLDELSDGRLILGLGNGTPAMMRNWHGVSGDAPAARMEELVDVLRKLWRLHEGPVDHDGRFYTVHLRPTAETPPPIQQRLPIWTAGVNPKMIEVAGKVSDGLVGHPMFTAEYVAEAVRPGLTAAAKAAGRDPADITLMGILMCAVDDDEEAARRRLAYAIAQYAPSRVYARIFALHGGAEVQQRILDAIREHDDDAVIAAVPDPVIDAIGVACAPGELAKRVAAHAVSYDHLNLAAPVWGLSPERAEEATLAILANAIPATDEE